MIPFSQSAESMKSSEIRALLNVAVRSDMISFAGGMPNNDLFPIQELDEIYANLTIESKKIAMQYGPTTGYPPLIQTLKKYLAEKGMPVEKNDLMITTGSMQGLALVAKIFLNPGDKVITENPCFVGGITAFKALQAELPNAPLDEDGICIESLDHTWRYKSPLCKILYITPNFHNPAGVIYSREKKLELLDWLRGKEIILLEDDPYGELYFDERDLPLTVPMKALGEKMPVPICYTGSFSKIFGPGMRLGWLLAPKPIIEKCELAKQSLDACSATFNQVLANEYMAQGKFSTYIKQLRINYASRLQIMLKSIQEYMPGYVQFSTPRGGFYIWITLPNEMDATAILKQSLANGAVFVVGKAFDPNGIKNNCFRLSFSYPPEEKIREGIKIIADVMKNLYGDTSRTGLAKP